MNYPNADLILALLTLLVPIAIAFVATMLGSYLLFTLPAWIKRRAHRRAVARAPRPERAFATVRPLRADNFNYGPSVMQSAQKHTARRTA